MEKHKDHNSKDLKGISGASPTGSDPSALAPLGSATPELASGDASGASRGLSSSPLSQDTRKLTVETYSCSCSDGVEYGLVVKQLHNDEGEEYVGDDAEASFMTVYRHDEQPVTDHEAYDANQELTMLSGLIARWNQSPAMVERIRALESALRANIQAFEKRDKLTVWRETEPDWWLEWNEQARAQQELLKAGT